MSSNEHKKIKEIDKRLGALKSHGKKLHGPTKKPNEVNQGMSDGIQAIADLVAGIGVGFLIGLFLDKTLNTRPWFLLLFLILGFVAGILNIIRSAKIRELKQKENDKLFPSNKKH